MTKSNDEIEDTVGRIERLPSDAFKYRETFEDVQTILHALRNRPEVVTVERIKRVDESLGAIGWNNALYFIQQRYPNGILIKEDKS
mgnify:CR=1 FL=1